MSKQGVTSSWFASLYVPLFDGRVFLFHAFFLPLDGRTFLAWKDQLFPGQLDYETGSNHLKTLSGGEGMSDGIEQVTTN